MGTRADFYAIKDGKPNWLGSIAYDGMPDSLPRGVLRAKSSELFERNVAKMLKSRDDATLPTQGWPWPWKDSWTSDYAYTWHDGRTIWTTGFDDTQGWTDKEPETDEEYDTLRVPAPFEMPNMKAQMNVTFGPRSGLLVLSIPKGS